MVIRAWPDWKHWHERDRQFTTMLNYVVDNASAMCPYHNVSRLGNGAFWHTLMAAPPAVSGKAGWECAK